MGKLAKPEKKFTGSFRRWTQRSPPQGERSTSSLSPEKSTGAAGTARKSVYDPELQKLHSTADAIDSMRPLQPSSGRQGSGNGSSSGGSRSGSANNNLNRNRSMPLPQVRGGSAQARMNMTSPKSPAATAPRSLPPYLSLNNSFSGTTGGGASAGNPFHKLYTPGPGAYSPGTDRFGMSNVASVGFGTARQRPAHVCIHDAVVSPGPVYNVSKEFTSTLASPPNIK